MLVPPLVPPEGGYLIDLESTKLNKEYAIPQYFQGVLKQFETGRNGGSGET